MPPTTCRQCGRTLDAESAASACPDCGEPAQKAFRSAPREMAPAVSAGERMPRAFDGEADDSRRPRIVLGLILLGCCVALGLFLLGGAALMWMGRNAYQLETEMERAEMESQMATMAAREAQERAELMRRQALLEDPNPIGILEPEKDAPPARLLVVGHRGLFKHTPENTLSGMKACLGLRISIELDVRRTRDGELVILHDGTLNRTTNGKGKVGDFTLEELKKLDAGAWFDPSFKNERLPTLDEVFALRARHPASAGVIAVDLKEADTEEDIVTLAKKHGVLDRLVFIGLAITDPDVRRRLRQADAKARSARLAPSAKDIDAAIKDDDADWVYVRFLPGREDVERIHAAGKRVFLSGPKVAGVAVDLWKEAAELGIDAILTDYPLELNAALRPTPPAVPRKD
ncbi:MAG: hypothetical protein K2R98_30925 [Gemmataceae bacterium]|nr:hypothetical protein [Gemmataceae bacterium]